MSIDKRKFNLNLGAKFILTIVIILSVTMLISAYYMYDVQNRTFLNNQQKQASVQAGFVSSISKEAVLSHDYISLNRIVRELTELEDIVHSNVISSSGQVMTNYINKRSLIIKDIFSNYKSVDETTIGKLLTNNPNVFLRKKPILLDDEVIGYINIWVDKSRIKDFLDGLLYVQLVNGVVIILALSAFIYLIFRINVLLPVRNLVSGATRVAEGNLDKEVQVKSNDELGTLTNAFNAMMRNLKSSIQKTKQSIDEVQSLNVHLEDRVQERTARLELSQKIALMGQWDYQPNTVKIELSKEARNILGFMDEDSISRLQVIKRIFLDDREKLYKAYYAAVRHNKAIKVELRVSTRTGGFGYVMVSARVEVKKGHKVLFGIIQDISEHKKAEESARRALIEKTNAESANKAKSAFLANMSHEIRTPLTAIIGFSEILLSKCEGSQQKSPMEAIYNNSKHLLKVINEILDLSKIESEKLEIEKINVDTAELFAELDSVMVMQANSKNIKFKTTLNYPLPRQIETDPVRLKQVLFNLANNSIKFTSEGHVHVNVEYNDDQSRLHIDVIDTGIGIKKDKLSSLFTPFTQADSSTTRQFGGTGLGLYISKQLVEMMGGAIHIDSVFGLGSKTSFYISTGKVRADDIITTPPKDKVIIIADALDKMDVSVQGSLLMVDDSEDNRKLIKLLLENTDVTITTAENGKQAVETALSLDFDLVLMDMQMPIMDGIEATKWLRAAGYTVPIVALTANAMKQERQQFLDAGCDDFLSKPINRKAFFATLKKYMKTVVTQDEDTGGIDAGMRELEQEFVNSLPERMQKISDGFSRPEYSLAQTECHKLKGIAGVYGYQNITEQAGKIEGSLKANELEKAHQAVNELLDLCQQAYRNFAVKYDIDQPSLKDKGYGSE